MDPVNINININLQRKVLLNFNTSGASQIWGRKKVFRAITNKLLPLLLFMDGLQTSVLCYQ